MLSYFGILYCTLVLFHIVSMDVGNNCYNYKTQAKVYASAVCKLPFRRPRSRNSNDSIGT